MYFASRRPGGQSVPFGGIEFVDQDLIESEVRDVNQLLSIRSADPVGVRRILALGGRAELCRVILQHAVWSPSFPSAPNRKYHHVAASVIRATKRNFPVRSNERWQGSSVRAPACSFRRVSLPLFGSIAKALTVLAFPISFAAYKIFSARMHHHPRWVFRFAGQFKRRSFFR